MECDGLTIRRMRQDDLAALYALLSDAEVMKFIEPPFSPERTAEFLKHTGLSEPPLIYAVDDARGEFAGYVIYHGYDADSVEIGWILKRSEWGKGYAQTLTAALLQRARSDGKSAVIECSPAQEATKHIALKNGFLYLGRSDGCDVFRLSP